MPVTTPTPKNYKTLAGHTSPETAFVVPDYPYGWKLRTSIRYWIETKKGHGQRFVSQTLNPKTGEWNKPKAGTYNVLAIMVQDLDNGHIEYVTLSSGGWSKEPEIVEFETKHASAIGDYERAAIKYIRATNLVNERLIVTIGPATPGTVHQTREEQSAIYRSALTGAYHELDRGANNE